MATATAKKLPIWTWEAKTRAGEVKKGEMEASDKASVEARLRQMGMNPAKIKKKPLEINIRLPGSTGVKRKDLVVFTRQFATMIDAGLPLVQCLEILGTQSASIPFRSIIKGVKEKVESGATLADGLAEHPKVFDELYCELVRAGEVGGILDTILNRLASYIENADRLVRKVRGALTYPVIVILVAIGVTVVLLVKVVPVFEKMFKDFGSALPGPTQMIVDMSHYARNNFWYAVVGIVVVVVSFKLITANPKGRYYWDLVKLKAPMFGDLIQKTAVARFTRTLGTMISSGVAILDALDVCAKSSGNKLVEEAIGKVRTGISEGKTIAQPLSEEKVFPQMVVQMIGVGEATGAMDQMLQKIADFYDEEVDQAVGSLTAMIEPLMMVFLGFVVGGFLIGMYLPIFTLAGAVK